MLTKALALVALAASFIGCASPHAPTLNASGASAVFLVYAHDGDPTKPPPDANAFWVAAWPNGEALLRPSFDGDCVIATIPPELVRRCADETWDAMGAVSARNRVQVRAGAPGMAAAVRKGDEDRMIAFSEGEDASELQGALKRCEQAIGELIESHSPAGVLDWTKYSWKPAKRR